MSDSSFPQAGSSIGQSAFPSRLHTASPHRRRGEAPGGFIYATENTVLHRDGRHRPRHRQIQRTNSRTAPRFRISGGRPSVRSPLLPPVQRDRELAVTSSASPGQPWSAGGPPAGADQLNRFPGGPVPPGPGLQLISRCRHGLDRLGHAGPSRQDQLGVSIRSVTQLDQ